MENKILNIIQKIIIIISLILLLLLILNCYYYLIILVVVIIFIIIFNIIVTIKMTVGVDIWLNEQTDIDKVMWLGNTKLLS